VGVVVVLALLLAAVPAMGVEPSPAPDAQMDLRMVARPLLGGTVRPGSWMAVRVRVENDGPAVRGELQVRGGQQGDSRYGVEVELPTGARQEHVLYAQPGWFSSGLTVQLVSDQQVLASQGLTTRTVDQYVPIIVVVAERPEGIVADIRAGTTLPNLSPPVILTVGPQELPSRVEAWSAIDRLVWQDMDTSALSDDQLASLRAWVGAGGRLVVVGGSTGTTTLGAFPPDLLPFQPTGTVDVPPADLSGLLGSLPTDATALPAVAGLLDSGTVLGRTGDEIFAAQRPVGLGAVTLVGIDPGTEWFAGTPAASAFWRRFLPANPNGAVINPLTIQDDSQIVGALSNLPAVDLPDLGVLFALLLLYIALIGPVNYLVLRRLDRREWAWITMPVLVGIFAVAAYAMGVGLKGTDTIVNQVGIVRAATGTDQGIGQVYVGIFSPTRASFDVAVGEGALLTNASYVQQSGSTVPLDVLQGDTARLRDFQVGFAVLRTFRAEAAVAVPRLDADLGYRDGVLSGTLHNRSDRTLESVALTWGGAVEVVDSLAPGASVPVSMTVGDQGNQGRPWSEQIMGPYPAGGSGSRTEATRRTVLDALGWSLGLSNGASQQGPMIVAWTSGAGLDIQLATTAKHVGDTLLFYPTTMTVTGRTLWTDPLLARSVLASDANEARDDVGTMALSRGTMTVEWRPMGYGGPFTATSLSMMLTQGERPALTGDGPLVPPLPADAQPAQDDPVGDIALASAPDGMGLKGGDDAGVAAPADQGVAEPQPVPAPAAFWDGLPDVQLFDRTAEAWVEFPHPTMQQEFRIAEPARYVDETGAFLVRLVNRGDQAMTTWFLPIVRLEGDAA